MRAWTYRTRGPALEVLKLDSSLEKPKPPTKSRLLIKVSHASLTPSFAHLTAVWPSLPFLSRPYVPEIDFSGVVELAGPDAPAHLGPGTNVWGSVQLSDILLYGAGALAEYVSVPAIFIAPLPKADGFGLAEAAGLQGNGQTAALMAKNGKVHNGSRVFINGGSGGVGTLVVQIAKAKGAYVVATGSGDNAELVKSLGADEVIDYRVRSPLSGYLAEKYSGSPFDAILDTIGTQALYTESPSYLKADGTFVNVGVMEGHLRTIATTAMNSLLPQFLGGTPRKFIFQQTNPDPDTMQYLNNLVEQGKLKTVIDQVFEMEDALHAYERIQSQRAKGKVVVKVQTV